jgi:hypothetical protein
VLTSSKIAYKIHMIFASVNGNEEKVEVENRKKSKTAEGIF